MIRRATIFDLEQIFAIYQSHCLDKSRLKDFQYLARVQKEGFIFDLDTLSDLKDDIDNATLFDVYEEGGEVLGLLIAKPKIYFPEDASNAHWLMPETKNLHYHSRQSMTLHLICVKKNIGHRGIGSQLLKNCFRQLKDQGIQSVFSIVTVGPVTNCASLNFHTKAGFERACVTSPIDILGFKNMQSILFYRDLSSKKSSKSS